MDRRVQKTRAAIQEAYISLLMEKKSMKMTITELAKKANIDRKTFYLHYDTTDDVMRDYNKQLINRLLYLLEQQGFFDENCNITNLYSAMNQVIAEHLDFFRHIANMDCKGFFWEQSKDILAMTILDMYKDKVSVSEEVLYLYGKFILTGTMEIYLEWLKGKLQISMEELGKLTSETAFRVLSPILK